MKQESTKTNFSFTLITTKISKKYIHNVYHFLAAGDETSTDIAAYDDTLPGYDEDEALDSYDAGADGQADYDPAAQEARRRRNGKSPAVGRAFRSNAVRNTKFCPGGRLNSCIAICPGGTPRVYASCVTSCGNRCPIRN